MKILHTVEFYWPSVGGSQEVVRQLSERLVKLGHEVTVATTKLSERTEKVHNGVEIAEFEISGKSATGISGEAERYQRFVLNGEFDVVMNYAATQWATDLVFPILDKLKARKVIVPCGYSMLHNPEFHQYFEELPDVLRKYDASVYLSNHYRDIDFARKHHIGNLHVIPNGAGADEFGEQSKIDIRKQLGIDPETTLILSVGTHTGEKGHAEAIEMFQKANITDAILVINGNPASWSMGCSRSCQIAARTWPLRRGQRKLRKRLVMTNLPRAELVAAYQAADLFLFPSNIEASPLVLFEAMASKTAFLTTDVGNTPEIIEWSGGGQLLPTTKDKDGYSHAKVEASAHRLEKLCADSSLRAKLAAAGFKAWQQKFSWEVITKRYEELYKEKK